jgi:seryl-tRNA synthetase
MNHGHRGLPPPIRPNTRTSHEEREYSRGSLSDFSDYESSDEEMHQSAGQSSGSRARKPWVNVSDNEDEEDVRRHIDDEDPFADPFGD